MNKKTMTEIKADMDKKSARFDVARDMIDRLDYVASYYTIDEEFNPDCDWHVRCKNASDFVEQVKQFIIDNI